jgi:Fur family iron response transcriptional regulator
MWRKAALRRMAQGALSIVPASDGRANRLELERMGDLHNKRPGPAVQLVRTAVTVSQGRSGTAEITRLLRKAGLRPTRQRLVLAARLFGDGDRHVTAELLHAEVVAAGERVSLATVYNTLHQFKAAGLLRELAVEGARAYFDTNTSNHNHFFFETTGELLDIPNDVVHVNGLPEPPAGMRISHIDVVVRLTKA